MFFGDTEYEGLDSTSPYTYKDGVLRDGDCVELFECECGDVEQEFDLEDPELNELEECGGGYLSGDSDDDNCGFTIDGEGDKKIIS